MEKQIDIKLKVIVAGNHKVGKTSLIRRYVENTFVENYISTVGVDFSAQSMNLPIETVEGPKELKMRYMIYDIGGQTQYRDRIQTWAASTMVYVICFDITDVQSFQDLPNWIQMIHEIVAKLPQPTGVLIPYTIVIVGTKRDLAPNPSDRKKTQFVTSTMVKNLLKKEHLEYYLETSSKTGDNVALLFKSLGQMAFNNLIRLNILELKQNGIVEKEIAQKYNEKHGYFPNPNKIQL